MSGKLLVDIESEVDMEALQAIVEDFARKTAIGEVSTTTTTSDLYDDRDPENIAEEQDFFYEQILRYAGEPSTAQEAN
jgi:hypothetical protein